MPVKILKMQSGEQVICGLSELTKDDQGVGFQLSQPFELKLIPSNDFGPDGQPTSFNVNYVRWMSCSVDTVYNVPYSAVVAIGEPEPGILETFIERFGANLNDINTISTSDSSDSPEGSGVSDSGDRGEGGES